MFFELHEEQRTLQQVARGLFDDLDALGRLRERWPASAVDPGVWRKLVDHGLVAIGLPEDQGGSGGDEVDAAVVCEEAGYAVVPEPLVATVGVVVPVLRDQSGAAQRDRWLGPLVDGEITVATAVDGTGRIVDPTGTDGASADAVLVVQDGAVHLVPGEAVEQRRRAAHDPSRPVVDLVGCRTDGTTLLPGADPASVQARARTARAAALVGVSQRMLDTTVAHARSRTQFGVPIGSFQAVQHQLADVLLAVEQARVAVWYAALRLRDDEDDALRAARIAKLVANQASQLADRVALQVHGGIGFTWEHDLHLLCKRAATWRAIDGESRVLRRGVADDVTGPATMRSAT